MKEHLGKGSFSFKPVSKSGIINAIKKLPSNKASVSNDIPVSVMKQFVNCYCEKLTNILKDCLEENRFPNLMKVAEISPVFKKLGNNSKPNYRCITTLSNFAKLLESIIYSQLNDYMKKKFSKYFTGLRKNYTQNSLLRLIESWKAKLNNGLIKEFSSIIFSYLYQSMTKQVMLMTVLCLPLTNGLLQL